jgi:YihY family inner membrane protein
MELMLGAGYDTHVKKKLDAFQRRYLVTSFPCAVQKKYSDDNGNYLAALVTFYCFLSIFPLLLAAFTITAYALSGDQSAVNSLEKHVTSYPIIGPATHDLVGKRLQGSPAAIAVGVLVLIWGAMGLARSAEFTMQEAWNVPGKKKLRFGPRLARGLGWYALIGTGATASTFLTSLGSIFSWSGGPALSALIALAFNVLYFLASFRILTPRATGTRDLVPGAVFAALCWTFLTGIGIGFAHKLGHSNQLYGSFASVLGLLAILYLTARLTIYGIEANVVRAQRLWPRSLTGEDLEPADRRQQINLAKREERVASMAVSVEFYDPNNSADMASAPAQTSGSDGEPTNTANRPGPKSENTGESTSTSRTTASP